MKKSLLIALVVLATVIVSLLSALMAVAGVVFAADGFLPLVLTSTTAPHVITGTAVVIAFVFSILWLSIGTQINGYGRNPAQIPVRMVLGLAASVVMGVFTFSATPTLGVVLAGSTAAILAGFGTLTLMSVAGVIAAWQRHDERMEESRCK